jgi:hypothetical protein
LARRKKNVVEFKYCLCGCGFTLAKYDSDHRERYYIKGHAWIGKKHTEETKKKFSESHKGKKNWNFGKPRSEEHKKKIGQAQLGELNHNFKGDNAGYAAIHYRIKKKFPKTKLCMLCKERIPKDLACLTANWKDESLKNWAWFCRACHMKWDNIIEKGWITRKKKEKIK